MAARKIPTIRLEARNDKAKANLGYHGDAWYLMEENHILKYNKIKGKCYVLRSRDGTKVLFVSMENDPDYGIRKV